MEGRRVPPHRKGAEPTVRGALKANARGDLNASVGSYFEDVNTASNLTSLIRSIDSCADTVAQQVASFTD